ncbi:MAG: hypothetical protein K2F87_05925, partial [Muribaculaceae bacterium]|nr:hypothetical protein [Muribaculaceae bacterium]
MDPAKVKEIAESMGMKISSDTTSQDIQYYILDNTAIDTAKAEVSAMNSAKKEQKRGRQKKVAKDTQEANAAASAEDSGNVTDTPKRRGRKPGSKKTTEKVPAAGAEKSDANPETPVAEASKPRRGRKPAKAAEPEAQVPTPALPLDFNGMHPAEV